MPTNDSRSNVRRTLVRNTGWNYIGLLVNLATNFCLLPFVVAHIGDDLAGVWLLLGLCTLFVW